MAGSEDNAPPKPPGEGTAGKGPAPKGASTVGVHQRPTPVKGVAVADLQKAAAPTGQHAAAPAAPAGGAGVPGSAFAPAGGRPSLFGSAPVVPSSTGVRKSIVPPPPGAKPLTGAVPPPPRPSSASLGAAKVPTLSSPATSLPKPAFGAPAGATALGAAAFKAPLGSPAGRPPPGAPVPLSALSSLAKMNLPPGPAARPAPAAPAPAAPKPANDEPELELGALGEESEEEAPGLSYSDRPTGEFEIAVSDRPTREVPAGPDPKPPVAVAPPPPRMPTLGPDVEFSFDISTMTASPSAVPPEPKADAIDLDHQPTSAYRALGPTGVPRVMPPAGLPDVEFSFGSASPVAAPAPASRPGVTSGPVADNSVDPLAGLDVDALDDEPAPAPVVPPRAAAPVAVPPRPPTPPFAAAPRPPTPPTPVGRTTGPLGGAPQRPAAPPTPPRAPAPPVAVSSDDIELAIDPMDDDFAPGAGFPPSRDSMEFTINPELTRTMKGAGPPSSFSTTSFAAVEPPAPNPRRELEERFALGDYSGALVIAEALLADQGDDPVVKRITADCRARLSQMYQSRLGSMDQIPCVAVEQSELKWMSLDHRAGFVLSLIDGYSSVEELLDLAGMPALDVLRTLYELLAQRVIELKPRPGRR